MPRRAKPPEIISEFKFKYYFLSNFYPCEILWEGKVWKTAEHIYQAMRTDHPLHREEILRAPTPGKAKRLGRQAPQREDWEEVKDEVMSEIVLQKFKQHKDLRKKLLATGDAELIEENWWGDTYWGVHKGEGDNRLGKILMNTREEIRNAGK